ncbi:MAG TPA: VWA domain-containing protein [Terriglobia bacterium]|nr:VWA domain-containing protein [Terriglobia bacterium]
MNLIFEYYWPLALLLLIPVLVLIQRRSAVDLSPKHQKLSLVIRCFLVVLLALAMMQPTLLRSSARLAVVYLLDVSHSVSPNAIQEGLSWIRKTEAAGGASSSTFVAFGSNSLAFDTVDALGRVPVGNKTQPGAINQTKTALASALDHAARSFPSDHIKRLVVLTDGNANAGNLDAAVEHLRLDGVRVYTRTLAARSSKDTWIEAMLAPGSVTAEEQFPVEVHVYSQAGGPAEIELRNGDRLLEKRKVRLTPALNRIAFATSVKDDSSSIVLEARVTTDGDPLADNNVFRKSAAVLGKPHILYIEGYAPSARYLRSALTIEGFQVEVSTADKLPTTADRLDRYDAVVISDVDRKDLTEQQMQAIATYVRDLGGGFVLAGGENTYGKDGYTGSTVEEVLPVTFETDKERQSITMVVVLDRSGSMAGSKMDLAKEATKAPLALLKEDDRFGVLTFDYNFQWALKIAEVKDKEAMRQTISKIVATGNTNIYPALREAYEQLKGAEGETKHIILLSDGQTPAEDFRGLSQEMVKDKITVSTVAVTAASDRVLMENIATWGGGRAYYVENPQTVPQIFQDETELAAGKSLQEENFVPAVKKNIEAFKGIDFKTAPELLGYVATKAKSTAEVILETPGKRPLLARWQYALGKSAIFTSDVKDRWAAEWLKWNNYSKFWAQLLRETMRRQDNDEFDLQVTRDGDEALITINAVEKDGRFRNLLHPKLRIVDPAQASSTIEVPQVGPGAYETRVPLNQDGTYVFRTLGDASSGVSRTLEFSYPDEYHFYPPNFEVLRDLSAGTGGVYQAAGPEIFDAGGETVNVHTRLWPFLASLALALYLVDVLLRRLRLFEA